MNLSTVFTKSAKGVMELSSRASRLPRDLMKVLKLVDGKSTVRQLAEAAGVSPTSLLATMEKLEKEGYVKEFAPTGSSPSTSGKPATASSPGDEGESLDFTIILNTGPLRPRAAEPDAGSRSREEAKRRAQEEAAARAREEAIRQARLAAERRAKVFAEACREADGAAQALADTQRRLDSAALALAQARAEADRHGKHLAEHKAKSQAPGTGSEGTLKALSGAIAAAHARAQALSTALEQASTQAQLLNLACGHAENRLAALARALEAADEKQKAALSQARGATEEQLKDLREARDTADQVVQALTRAQAEALAEGQTLVEVRARLEAEAAARAERKTAALARAEQEAIAQEAARQAAEKQRPALTQALERAETLARERLPQAARAQSRTLSPEEQAQAAEVAKAQTQAWAEALADAASKLEAMIPPLGEAVTRGQHQATALQEAIGESEGGAELLHDALNRVQAQTAALEQELATVTARLDALHRARDQAMGEIEALADLATRAREEAERRAREAEERRREEAARQAREEAERRAREEGEGRRAEEADRLPREEAAQGRAQELAEGQERAPATPEDQVQGPEPEPPGPLPPEAAAEAEDRSSPPEAERRAREVTPPGAEDTAALAALGIEVVEAKLFNPETTQQLPSAAQLERELEREAQERARKQREEDERLRLEAERHRREAEEQARQEALFRAQAEEERNLWDRAETCPPPVASTHPATERESLPPPVGEAVPAPPRPRRRNVALGRWLGLGVAVAVAGAVALAHVLPWQFAVPAAQAVLSARLGEPVSVEEVRGALFPTPQLRLHGIKVGRDGALTAGTLIVAGFAGLLGRSDEISAVRIEQVTLRATALERLKAWSRPVPVGAGTGLETITVHQARLEGTGIEVPPFDAEVSLASDGTVQRIALRAVDGSLSGDIVPSRGGLKIQANGRTWRTPLGVPLVFENLQIKAAAVPGQLEVEQFDALLYGGRVVGSGTLAWNGVWTASGEAELVSVDLAALISAYLGEAPVTGTLRSRMLFELEGQSLQQLFDAPRVKGNFVVERGALTGVDLSKALRGGAAGSSRGETAFQQLTGTLALAANRYEFRSLRLTTGILSATGMLEVAPDRSLSGSTQVEIRSETNPLRGSLALRGTVTQPVARP